MREYVRYTVNLCVAFAMKLLAIMLDIFLLSIFIAHMRLAARTEDSLIGIGSAQKAGSAYPNTELM